MKISAKAEYAVRAITYLALCGNESSQISNIASRERIPAKFLEHIFSELKKAGIVLCKRGAGGGCCLAKPPEEITVGEVIRIFDGCLGPVNGIERMRSGDGLTAAEHCLRSTWLRTADALSEVLDELDFATVAAQRRANAVLSPQAITHGMAWF